MKKRKEPIKSGRRFEAEKIARKHEEFVEEKMRELFTRIEFRVEQKRE